MNSYFSIRLRAAERDIEAVGHFAEGDGCLECCMLYSMHRTQLYLDESQYRWLKNSAGERGSIAAVVRELIDNARARKPSLASDPLIHYLTDETAGEGASPSTVETLDRDIYG